MKAPTCKHCGSQHDLAYQRQIDGRLNLIYVCDQRADRKFRPMTVFVPFIKGLNIPTVDSRKLAKAQLPEKPKPQQLFDLGV